MTLKEKIDREIKDKLEAETRPLFPSIYEGYAETDALAQAEDELLKIFRGLIYKYAQNRNLQTLTEDAATEYENGLRLAHTGTMEERRAAIIAAINRRIVLNDATLHEICQGLAPDFTVYEKTDPQELTLGVFTTEDGEDGELPAVGIVDTIRPTVPQNLALYAGVETTFERGTVINHANFSALKTGLGKVERRAPDPNMIVVDNEGNIIGGLSESVTAIELETLIVPNEELIIIEGEELETMEILLALKMTNRTTPISITFPANDYYWGGILSNEDKARVEAFGLDVSTADYNFGEIVAYKTTYHYDYTFEPLALYADVAGEVLNTDDMSNFYCSMRPSTKILTINNYQAYSTPSMTWKCRITRTIR